MLSVASISSFKPVPRINLKRERFGSSEKLSRRRHPRRVAPAWTGGRDFALLALGLGRGRQAHCDCYAPTARRNRSRQIEGRQRIGATSDHRLGEARIAHDPASQRRADSRRHRRKRSNRVAGGGCSKRRCRRADNVRAFDLRAAAPRVASGSSSSRRQLWLVRASLSKSTCRGPSLVQMAAKIRRLAGKSKLVAAAAYIVGQFVPQRPSASGPWLAGPTPP